MLFWSFSLITATESTLGYLTLYKPIINYYILIVCVCVCTMYVYVHVCHMHIRGSQSTNLWSWFSPSTFMSVPGIKLRSPGLFDKNLYLLSHLPPHKTVAIPEAAMVYCTGTLVLLVGT